MKWWLQPIPVLTAFSFFGILFLLGLSAAMGSIYAFGNVLFLGVGFVWVLGTTPGFRDGI